MILARLLLVALATSALAGCVSPAERRMADIDRCRGYGFQPGSAPFSACLQNIDLDRSADRRAFLYGSPGPGLGFGYGPGLGLGVRRGWY